MEALGRLVNVIPIAAGRGISLKNATGITFVTTGNDTFTVTTSDSFGGTYNNTGLATLVGVVNVYKSSATNGSAAWVKDNTLIATNTIVSGGAIATCFTINAASLPDGRSYVRVSVGGKLDPGAGTAVEVEGRIQKKLLHHALGRMVALDLGHVKLVLTEGHAMAVKPEFYGDIGLSPWRADIVVVKNFFPFRIFFAPMARKVIYVRTEGVTDLDAAFRLKFDGPVWPRDAVHEWRSTDARRRAPSAEDREEPTARPPEVAR